MSFISHTLYFLLLSMQLVSFCASHSSPDVAAALQRADYYAEKACDYESELYDWMYEKFEAGETDVSEAEWNDVVCRKIEKAAQFVGMARDEIGDVLPKNNREIRRSDYWMRVEMLYDALNPEHIKDLKDCYRSEYIVMLLGNDCSFLQMYMVTISNNYRSIDSGRKEIDELLTGSK